jgi:hypothetical protein
MLKTTIRKDVPETVASCCFLLFMPVRFYFPGFWPIGPFDLSYAKFSGYDVR